MRALANVPCAGSACHGGMVPSATRAPTARAHGRTSLYVISDIGAISPGRWQLVQLANRIGATSLLYVGVCCADAVETADKAAAQTSAGTTRRVIKTSPKECPNTLPHGRARSTRPLHSFDGWR